tara:strand:+ start:125 stop:421 length:297 start_codon:yes stop_codon:yes gene_type:complete
MPSYDFLNTETGVLEEHFMSYKDLDEFKRNNPHLLQQITAPQIIGGHGDRVKTDAGFKEVLARIGEGHPGSKLNQNKSIKDIKTKEVVKKHIALQNKK